MVIDYENFNWTNEEIKKEKEARRQKGKQNYNMGVGCRDCFPFC